MRQPAPYLTAQPQGAVDINWLNPLSRGLVSCINGGESGILGCLVTKRRSWDSTARAGSAITSGPTGRSITNSAGGANGIAWDRQSNTDRGPEGWYSASPLRTWAAVIYPIAFGSSHNIAGVGIGSGSGAYFYSHFSDGTIIASLTDGGGTHSAQAITGWLKLNQLNVIVARSDGATLTLWANGVNAASAAVSGSAISYNSFAQVAFGGSGSPFGITGSGGAYHFSPLWLRALSDGEIVSFSRNPWQLLSSINPRRPGFGLGGAAPDIFFGQACL